MPPQEFATAVTGVLSQRLLRTLCDQCKEPYSPPPQVLQQFGIPDGRIETFFRPPKPKGDDDQGGRCLNCGGIGYLGQTAIFELLVMNDAIRKVLGAGPRRRCSVRRPSSRACEASWKKASCWWRGA